MNDWIDLTSDILLYLFFIFTLFSNTFAHLFTLFHFSLLSDHSLGDMVISLGFSFFYTFFDTINGIIFLSLPFLAIIVKTCNQVRFEHIKKNTLKVLKLASPLMYFAFISPWIGIGDYSADMEENIIGTMFTVDFVQLWIWAWVMTAYKKTDVLSFLLGPLYVICELCERTVDLKFQLVPFLSVMLTAIPNLFFGHTQMMELFGEKVLRGNVPYHKWHPFQTYALVQILFGFVAFCTLVPTFRLKLQTLAVISAVAIVPNANIAAAASLFL